ncbi:MAG: replication-associated recombination protein A [Salibacteraceae bacterium]
MASQSTEIPLAERLRPRSLDDFIGQRHLVGENGPLRLALDAGSLPSMILWGPPGVGKTTLAQILSNATGRSMFSLSAINSGVKEVREVIDRAARPDLLSAGRPILFIDEIHRFSKSQQDSLLGAVEKGLVTLIGATTENPSFEVISALLSRVQVYILEPLSADSLKQLLHRAIQTDPWLKEHKIALRETDALIRISGGDARKLLNALEIVVRALGRGATITNEKVTRVIKSNLSLYDKSGEQHYDIVSAFIKSIRGSDPNAAVYWLARMIEGGEDPKFIARRLLILASEDIGNANPQALLVANACYQAVHTIGYPECRITLSQCAIYLATSAKSNASYQAINAAQKAVSEHGDLPVPLHLRNAPTRLMKDIGYGDGYQYSHSYEGNFIDQEYLPEKLSGNIFYEPGSNRREGSIREWLKKIWAGRYDYSDKKEGPNNS